MDESEQMFNLGVWGLVAVMLLTAALQVAYRVQNGAMVRAGRGIDEARQQIDIASANFSAYVRPEILRSLVNGIYPDAEPVSFNKTVAANEL
jgi:hypothetical protein